MIANHRTAIPIFETEALLPWRATGRLSGLQCRQIDGALARDTALMLTFAEIQQERSNIVTMNEQLGQPSTRALVALFAAIDLDATSREKSS